jgi:hypothetical protein
LDWDGYPTSIVRFLLLNSLGSCINENEITVRAHRQTADDNKIVIFVREHNKYSKFSDTKRGEAGRQDGWISAM